MLIDAILGEFSVVRLERDSRIMVALRSGEFSSCLMYLLWRSLEILNVSSVSFGLILNFFGLKFWE
jgi:hypothetical protein